MYMPATINKKLKSVLADNQSDDIDHYLVSLGLLYFRLAGPCWELLARGLHYLDFYDHVAAIQ